MAPSENLVPAPSGLELPLDLVATHQRERILAATIDLVAKRGYRGTSIDQIVKGARVGYPAFYQLFEGKEQCFCAAFDLVVAQARERIAASVGVAAPWPEQVCAALRSLLELIAAEPLRARIVLAEAQNAGEAAVRRHQQLLDRAALLLAPGRALNPDGEKLPSTLEEATVGGVVWLLHDRAVRGELEGVERLFGELVLIVLEPYLGAAQVRALIARRSAKA